MPKRWKNYRRIVVADHTLRWRTDSHSPYQIHSRAYAESGESWEPDRLLIRLESDPKQLLTVVWPACTAPAAITPGLVASYIHTALDSGWLTEKCNLEIGADSLKDS